MTNIASISTVSQCILDIVGMEYQLTAEATKSSRIAMIAESSQAVQLVLAFADGNSVV